MDDIPTEVASTLGKVANQLSSGKTTQRKVAGVDVIATSCYLQVLDELAIYIYVHSCAGGTKVPTQRAGQRAGAGRAGPKNSVAEAEQEA